MNVQILCKNGEKTLTLKCYKDTKNIVKLNWCKFVKEHLMETTKKWLDGESFFTGPLIFLMVSYFDRVQRKGLEISRQVPLISLWNQEKFHTRLKFEKDLEFGKGKVPERMKLNVGLEKRQENDKGKKKEQPLTIREKQGEKKVIKKQGKDKGKEKVVENQSMTCDSITSPNDMMDFLSKFGDLAKSLASNVKEMYSMLEQAKDIFVEEETTGKMHHLIDNIWCKYTTKNKKKSKNKDKRIIKKKGKRQRKEKDKRSKKEKGKKRMKEKKRQKRKLKQRKGNQCNLLIGIFNTLVLV